MTKNFFSAPRANSNRRNNRVRENNSTPLVDNKRKDRTPTDLVVDDSHNLTTLTNNIFDTIEHSSKRRRTSHTTMTLVIAAAADTSYRDDLVDYFHRSKRIFRTRLTPASPTSTPTEVACHSDDDSSMRVQCATPPVEPTNTPSTNLIPCGREPSQETQPLRSILKHDKRSFDECNYVSPLTPGNLKANTADNGEDTYSCAFDRIKELRLQAKMEADGYFIDFGDDSDSDDDDDDDQTTEGEVVVKKVKSDKKCSFHDNESGNRVTEVQFFEKWQIQRWQWPDHLRPWWHEITIEDRMDFPWVWDELTEEQQNEILDAGLKAEGERMAKAANEARVLEEAAERKMAVKDRDDEDLEEVIEQERLRQAAKSKAEAQAAFDNFEDDVDGQDALQLPAYSEEDELENIIAEEKAREEAKRAAEELLDEDLEEINLEDLEQYRDHNSRSADTTEQEQIQDSKSESADLNDVEQAKEQGDNALTAANSASFPQFQPYSKEDELEDIIAEEEALEEAKAREAAASKPSGDLDGDNESTEQEEAREQDDNASATANDGPLPDFGPYSEEDELELIIAEEKAREEEKKACEAAAKAFDDQVAASWANKQDDDESDDAEDENGVENTDIATDPEHGEPSEPPQSYMPDDDWEDNYVPGNCFSWLPGVRTVCRNWGYPNPSKPGVGLNYTMQQIHGPSKLRIVENAYTDEELEAMANDTRLSAPSNLDAEGDTIMKDAPDSEPEQGVTNNEDSDSDTDATAHNESNAPPPKKPQFTPSGIPIKAPRGYTPGLPAAWFMSATKRVYRDYKNVAPHTFKDPSIFLRSDVHELSNLRYMETMDGMREFATGVNVPEETAEGDTQERLFEKVVAAEDEIAVEQVDSEDAVPVENQTVEPNASEEAVPVKYQTVEPNATSTDSINLQQLDPVIEENNSDTNATAETLENPKDAVASTEQVDHVNDKPPKTPEIDIAEDPIMRQLRPGEMQTPNLSNNHESDEELDDTPAEAEQGATSHLPALPLMNPINEDSNSHTCSESDADDSIHGTGSDSTLRRAQESHVQVINAAQDTILDVDYQVGIAGVSLLVFILILIWMIMKVLLFFLKRFIAGGEEARPTHRATTPQTTMALPPPPALEQNAASPSHTPSRSGRTYLTLPIESTLECPTRAKETKNNTVTNLSLSPPSSSHLKSRLAELRTEKLDLIEHVEKKNQTRTRRIGFALEDNIVHTISEADVTVSEYDHERLKTQIRARRKARTEEQE
ncbi:hypothetical protein EJ08DRAFT_677680 [Tothia fuscella]|uniref:Uncharacterized protein n=1 Tax=Tothia fuscella TaxID=1048955 RepID=A0A9P4NUG8_9PEZI|nr:hypothetical protein EJ08DRAFT_677680 [Tothia fuscella]